MKKDDILKEIASELEALSALVGKLVTAEEDHTMPKEEPLPKPKVTKIDLRKVLAEKANAGFGQEVRAILKAHGASKLSLVKEEEYPAMMEEAKRIGTDQ